MSTFREDAKLVAGMNHVEGNLARIVNHFKNLQADIDSAINGIAAMQASGIPFLVDGAAKASAQLQADIAEAGGLELIGTSLEKLSKFAGYDGTADELRVTKGGEVIEEVKK